MSRLSVGFSNIVLGTTVLFMKYDGFKGMPWYFHAKLAADIPEDNYKFEAEPRTKAELLALLTSEGERFATWVEELSDDFLNETFLDPSGANPKTRFESIAGTKEHQMHHRAQLMLAERLLGITPHMTRTMQERMAARAAAAK